MNENRYIRQTTLKEVGVEGQKKLLNTAVLVVGCGGLGNYVAVNLAASGIGKIHLIDNDIINISNIHRQVFFKTEDIGKSKAKVLNKYIKSLNEDVDVNFSIENLNKNNTRELIKEYDYILECTDSLETKYMLNDACVLENKPLIYGSLHKFEAQISSFNIQEEKKKYSANLRDVFPEIPTENIPTCSETGTLNPIVGIAALLQANEVLKLVLNIGKPLINALLIYNSLDNTQLKVKIKPLRNIDFEEKWKENNYMDESCSLLDSNEIEAEEFLKRVKNKTLKVISVLEEDTEIITPDFHFPFSYFDADEIELEKNDYAILCMNGRISMACVFMLRKKYPNYSFKSLSGGLYSIV